jgi:hypothetical protein
MPHHAGFRRSSKPRKANIHACFRCYNASKPPTRFPEDPENKATNGGVDFHGKHPQPPPKGGSLTTGRVLHRPRQHSADAPLAWFVTAVHIAVQLAGFSKDVSSFGRQRSIPSNRISRISGVRSL